MTSEERASVIEECVRLALEKAIKLEIADLTESGSRLNPTAYQWRTIANDLRELARN